MGRKKAGLGVGVWMAFILLVAVFGVVLNVPLVRASGTIYIRADGSIDPSTAPISTVDKVTYTFTDNIYDSLVVERGNIVVNGAGHVLEGAGTGNGMSLTGRSNVTIKSITIRNFYYGITLTSSSGNTLSANTITNINSVGIYLYSSSTNNRISSNTLTNNSYCAVFLSSSNDNIISANTLTNNNNFGISLYSSSGNSISSNAMTKNYDSIYLYTSSNYNIISANTITDSPNYGISLSSSLGNIISANTITNSSGDGIRLSSSSNDNSISQNILTNNHNDGIYLSNSANNNSITGNTIANNTQYGIYLLSSTNDNSITANTITNNYDGIYLFSNTENNSISANTITNNQNDGIYLSLSSNNNIISANSIANNTDGIYLDGPSGNIISTNTITDNDVGIELSAYSNNFMYHNNFVGNTAQTDASPGSSDTWDDNYWSDYNGTDLNHDGIGDTPYIIDGNKTDYYPLMKLYETPPPTITILSPENKTYTTNTGISLTFIVDEPASWMGYSLNTQPNATVTRNTTLPTLSDGWHSVVVYANNTFGDMGASGTIHFTVDTTTPATTHDYNGLWHSADFTITLSATDNVGVNETYYRINSGPALPVSLNGQPRITTEGANNTLEYWSVDTNNNVEPHKTLTQIKLDKTTPTAWIQINNGEAYTNSTAVNLKLLAADAVSGVSQMRFSNDGGVWSSWEAYSNSKSWSLQAGDGVKNVFVQYKDLVDLTVTAYQIITLDMTNPIANAGQNQTVTVGTSATFNGSGSTDNMGITSYSWDFGDNSYGTGVAPTHVYSSVGTFTVKLMVKDFAGNSATSSALVTVEVVIPEFPSAAVLVLFVVLASALALGFGGKHKLGNQAIQKHRQTR